MNTPKPQRIQPIGFAGRLDATSPPTTAEATISASTRTKNDERVVGGIGGRRARPRPPLLRSASAMLAATQDQARAAALRRLTARVLSQIERCAGSIVSSTTRPQVGGERLPCPSARAAGRRTPRACAARRSGGGRSGGRRSAARARAGQEERRDDERRDGDREVRAARERREHGLADEHERDVRDAQDHRQRAVDERPSRSRGRSRRGGSAASRPRRRARHRRTRRRRVASASWSGTPTAVSASTTIDASRRPAANANHLNC